MMLIVKCVPADKEDFAFHSVYVLLVALSEKKGVTVRKINAVQKSVIAMLINNNVIHCFVQTVLEIIKRRIAKIAKF